MVIKLPEVVKNDTLPDGFKQESEVTKPIEDLGVVVLDNKQITITSGVLEALLENNCAIITCDSKSMPVGLMLPLYGNTTQNERFRQQLDASLPLMKQLWQQTIKAKIENQAVVLKEYSDVETKCMNVWAADVKSGDSNNLEARAAAYYWKNLKDIPQRQLADNDEYHALIQKKIAAENALKALISEEAWRCYLELDAIGNELESVRLEAVYLAGASDYEKLSK